MAANEVCRELVGQIEDMVGQPVHDTFLDNYLGNTHPKYRIRNPALRLLAKNWLRDNPLDPEEFIGLIDGLISGPTSTEKCLAGIMLDYKPKMPVEPYMVDRWLNDLEGWVEVDTLCTSKFTSYAIPLNWKGWSSLLQKLSKSKNVNKRRASLVLFCRPVRNLYDERWIPIIFRNVERLSSEKDVLITKAISWVLRSMIKLYRKEVKMFLNENKSVLPAIALREVKSKLETGRK